MLGWKSKLHTNAPLSNNRISLAVFTFAYKSWGPPKSSGYWHSIRVTLRERGFSLLKQERPLFTTCSFFLGTSSFSTLEWRTRVWYRCHLFGAECDSTFLSQITNKCGIVLRVIMSNATQIYGKILNFVTDFLTCRIRIYSWIYKEEPLSTVGVSHRSMGFWVFDKRIVIWEYTT